jgi:hypothetical protein
MDHDAQVLHSGQRHAEQLISALRAIVALDGQKRQLRLEREENTRNRHLQTTIFVVGAALSISGLAAATRPRPAAKLLAALAKPEPAPALLWLADIGIHFLLGLAAAFFVLLLWLAWSKARSGRRG